mgnify:CR=1 FL=1
MSYILQIEAHNQPSVMERVLQTTRYRGFQICGFTMKTEANNKISLEMVINSDKAIHLLTSQLNKLYDLTSIELTHTEAAAALA